MLPGSVKNHLRSSRIRLSAPLFPLVYEFQLDKIADPTSVDERIERLASIREDLIDAIDAVKSLEEDSVQKKQELERLGETIERLNEDKATIEESLQIPQEAFARVIAKANSKTRWSGRIEGLIIGMFTGVGSSLLVWYVTSS